MHRQPRNLSSHGRNRSARLDTRHAIHQACRSLVGLVVLVLAGATAGCGGDLMCVSQAEPAGGWYAPAVYATGTERDATRWESSEARLDGGVSYLRDVTSYPLSDDGESEMWVAAGDVDLSDADHRWSGMVTEVGATQPDLVVRTFILEGIGVDEGWSAYLVSESTDGADPTFRGFLFPGPMPALPRLKATPEDVPAWDGFTPAVVVTGEWRDGDHWEASDPFIGGRVATRSDWKPYGGWHHCEPGMAISAGTYRIINPGGQWKGIFTEMSAQEPDFGIGTVLLRGEGDHAGFSAYLVTASTQHGEPTFRGVILPGPMPMPPGW